MSKAFTDEESADPPRVVPPRAPLPEGVPNYVTGRGLRLLHEELAALQARRAAAERAPDDQSRTRELAELAQRRAELEARISSAARVPAPPPPRDRVRFGALVTTRGERGLRRHRIVGVDEADAARGEIAFVLPLARALLGRAVGERVALRTPRGEEALEIVALEYPSEAEDG